MVLLVLVRSDILHLLTVVVVQFVVGRFLLSQINCTVLGQVVLLYQFYDFLVLVGLFGTLGEVEISGGSALLGLHDGGDWAVEVLGFGQSFVGFGVAQVHCAADLVDFAGSLRHFGVTL